MRWVDYIKSALENLGGWATYDDLYAELKRIRQDNFTQSWKATVRNSVESNSSDSENWSPKRPDLFYSVNGLGSGVWGLREFSSKTPPAVDIEAPERTKQETYRILRDTELARSVKAIHEYKCQICSLSILLPNGKSYAEAHHIKPLGAPHNGPDVAENIICLCPNHHAMLDYGVIEMNLGSLKKNERHSISQVYVSYHNNNIYGKEIT